MKTPLFISLFILFLFSCNTTDQESNSKDGGKDNIATPAEMSYIGKPINRFDQAIENMKREDSTRVARENEVVFTGSSSIRLWNTLAFDFDPIPVLNRGFGGSILPEVIHYADQLIFNYQPELIVLYCGENDIADGASAEQVLASFTQLDELIREKLPDSKMIYISMKPSPSRIKYWEEYKKGNTLIKDYIKMQEGRSYIDCSTVMLQEDESPDPSIFIEDELHMNAEGYKRWTQLIKPQVEKAYNQLSAIPATQ